MVHKLKRDHIRDPYRQTDKNRTKDPLKPSPNCVPRFQYILVVPVNAFNRALELYILVFLHVPYLSLGSGNIPLKSSVVWRLRKKKTTTLSSFKIQFNQRYHWGNWHLEIFCTVNEMAKFLRIKFYLMSLFINHLYFNNTCSAKQL